MSSTVFDLGTCTCVVDAPGDVLKIMNLYLTPYRVAPVRPFEFRIRARRDRTHMAFVQRNHRGTAPHQEQASHPEQRYCLWTEPGHKLLIPRGDESHVIEINNRHIDITAETHEVAATIAIRVVRQLMMRGGEARGGHVAHAGAVQLHGETILIGGHAGAGKTTVLTHLVEHHDARPLANDRTVLVPQGVGEWAVTGIPLAWRITPQGMRDSLALSAVNLSRLSRGAAQVNGKIELTPSEIDNVMGCSTVSSAPLARIVLLRRSHECVSVPDSTTLASQLDLGKDDPFAHDWLELRPQLGHGVYGASHRCIWHHLRAEVPTRSLSWKDPAELRELATAIAEGVPA
ncbi:hypothetical protein [Actinopolyspora sp. H202]|uniref:hypothetical protein n=1 Tax=Actinopolyspora sp. H202 TaxID=1500456 RepID=UPI00102CDF67